MNGLYIHIPFCERKCLYCDFPSYAGCLSEADRYIDAVIGESAQYEGFAPDTVFIGGGTPSVLPAGKLKKLISGIRRYIDFNNVIEFSSEANPNSFDAQTAEEFAEIGINRLSLGLQSAEPHLLRRIGRLHTAEDFSRAVEYARAAGITNINADLMYSLPDQALADLDHTLGFVLSHPLSHISAYALKLEEGTPLFQEDPPLPDEDADREMFRMICGRLAENGFHRYEISNFAKENCECLHILVYWHVEPYIGLGAGAHSCYREMRFSNPRTIDAYITGEPQEREPADPQFEKIMLGTRLTEGIDASLLPDTAKMRSFIALLEKNHLASVTNGRFILTHRGMDIQNEILTELFTRI